MGATERREFRALNAALRRERARLDAEIAATGAVARLARLRPLDVPSPASLPWRRIAAAVLVAAAAGGVFGMLVPDTGDPDAAELALVDPLLFFEAAP